MTVKNPATRVARRNIIIMLAVMLVSTIALIPAEAFAGDSSGSSATVACVESKDGQYDYTSCLPAGRWGGYVGTVTSRIEPSKGVAGSLSNFRAQVGSAMRHIMPDMLLQLTQVCWSSALALSQFAASFQPLDAVGAQVDTATANLIDSVMKGGIPAALMVLAIIVWIGAAAFDIGTVKEAGKRLLATVLCLASLLVLGAGAAKTGENATSPATGSPWWVVKTVNDTVNNLTVGLSLDSLNDSDPNMMAYDNKGNGKKTNCQDYLYQMHEQYKNSGAVNAGGETSAVTSAVNRLWEETALRNWVTMQWNSPQAGANVTDQEASNARQAYCHVLDLQAGTSHVIQRELTNAAMGTNIDDETGRWIFTDSGWISTLNSVVDDGDSQDDRDSYVRATRAGIFWETCGTKNVNGTYEAYARDGWGILINNLGDDPTGEIKNSGKKVRVKLGASSLQDVEPTNPSTLMVASLDDPNGATTSLCKVILSGSENKENGVFHRTKGDGYGLDRSSSDATTNQQDTNVGDAATLGWRFDVPNVGATWNEVNIPNINKKDSNNGAMKSTIDYLYGNANPDTLGAFGSVIGAFCNMVVWGAFSLILIISKLMLVLMGLFLVISFLVRAFPIGEAPKKVLRRWVKQTCNLSITGLIYSAVATVATFICSITLRACSSMSGTFMYNIISGVSPAMALLVMGMFCTQVLKIGNIFSFKAMLGIAGAGALANGLASAPRALAKGMMGGAALNALRRDRKHARERISSRYAGGASGGADSEKIVDKASEEQSSPVNEKRTTSSEPSPSTIRSSLVPPMERMKNSVNKVKEQFNDRRDDYISAYMSRNQGASLADAQKYANRRQSLHAIASGAASVGTLAGVGARFALDAAKSKPLRDVATRTAKVAATAGVGALAFSSPITAPLGVAAMAKLATNRNAWHGASVGLKAVGNTAGVLRQRMNENRPARSMSDLRQQIEGVGMNASDMLSKAEDKLGITDMKQTIQNGGAAFVDTSTGEPLVNPFALDGQADTPTQTIPPQQESFNAAYESAFNQVRSGIMADCINNQHMTSEEAEATVIQMSRSGELNNAVMKYFNSKFETFDNNNEQQGGQ